MCELCENIPICFTNILSNIIWRYNDFIVSCESIINDLYDENMIIRNSFDYINSIKNNVSKFFYITYEEPCTSCWTSIVYLYKNDDEVKFKENYKIINNDNESFVYQVTKDDISILENKNKNLVLFMCFLQNNYLIYNSDNYIKNNTFQFKKTNIQVLSIFYSHPEMDDNIQLNNSPNIFIVNNNLFNAAHILRCLKMQNEYFIFDEQYSVIIMDSNINEYEIKYNNYLHVYEDKFEILLI